MEKISPEKFSFIRDALRKSWLDFTSAPKNANNVVNLLNEKYIRYEKELLNYDLSDIPFDSWFSIVLIGTENNILDFSKTKANIDFNKVICKGYVNFKGCNLRNVDSLNGYHFPEMFDEDVVKSDNSYFLSDKFDKKFKKKYYSGILDISDLSKLSKEQIIEISKKKYNDKLKKDFNYSFMLQIISLKNVIELYNNYNKEYETVGKILELFKEEKYNVALNDFVEKVKNMNTNQIKNECFELVKKCLNSYDNKFLSLPSLPELFQKENSYLYLKNINIPKEVKRRYFERKLTLKDLVRYPNAFNNLVFDYSTDYPLAKIINEKFGPGEFQKLVRNHLDVFNHLVEDNTPLTFTSFFQKNMTDNIEESLAKTVKHYYNYFEPYSNDGNIPNWMSSINFKIIDRISTKEELYGYNEFVIIENDGHQLLIDNMGIENIKKFDEEYGFFTHYERLQLFDLLARSLNYRNRNNFENGTLSYEEFCNIFAAFLDNIRKTGVFSNYNYNWIQGKFRDEHPEIFIDENAPESLKEAFFSQGITADKLFFNKNWIPFLVDKNLSNTINTPINLITSNQSIDNKIDFIKEYSSRHGNKKTLELIAKYGAILSNINIMTDDIESESAVELAIQSAIYNRMISRTMDYRYLESVPDFSSKYPEYFLNLSNSNDSELFKNLSLDTAFYGGYFEYDTIRKYPQLIQILKDKNLFIPFRQRNGEYIDGRIINSRGYSELELILAYGNEKFLELCARYGSYLKNIPKYLYGEVLFIDGKYYRLNNLSKKLEFNDIINIIDDIIAKECKNGILLYDDDVAPDFLKEKSPELFLSEDAPSELKMRFYSYGHIKLDFYNLQSHKEWLPYLKGKSVKTALIKGSDRPVYFQGYFACFGEELGIELGIKKPETVTYMINSEKINVMWEWYIKTGKKFIPDYVVMNNFSLEEADKFLSSASNWSTLMKIERFAKNSDARDALLKLAYSFGVFDHNQKGLKKLIDLLSYIPRKIDVQDEDVIKKVDSIIDLNSARNSWINPKMPPDYKEKAVNDMIDYMRKMCVSSTITITISYKELYDLFIAIKNEKVNVDFAKPIFSQIYRKNDDGSYSLTINPQNYPKTAEAIRSTLEKFSELSLMSPSRIHHYIGGFKLEYDPEFREFFLKNYDTIMNDNKYLSQIAIIQRRFKEIKAVYSNVTLTLDLALSYITNNRYEQVNPGNERVTTTAAIQGYSQEDFETLQKIYNYGKQRVFSSIPRIESNGFVELKTGKYHYEMLRLDDPRAMSIGYESDCCQRLGEPAEMCMQHSMVDKNGRVFVITNELGEVVAQSWVWRNKDVLCFDNIEIPDQKMWDHGVPRGSEDSGIRNEFTDDILDIYKMAAHELIEEDEKEYKELLESGKITQEQYDGLRLKKISTGEGYSNIIGSLKTLPVDKGEISRPLLFEAPVDLYHGLYTSDSTKQYIIEEREGRKKYSGETLTLYSDTYIEYDDTNFTEKELESLKKLKMVTCDNMQYPFDDIDESTENIVSQISYDYNLNQVTTRIILHPNFAIIYDTYGDKVTIGDLLFNTKIDNYDQQMDITDKVIMQIRLAINQISNGKQIVLQDLSEKQQQMYEKVMGLRDEMDIERGVGHAR